MTPCSLLSMEKIEEFAVAQLWEIVQTYRQRFAPHPPSIRRIAAQVGMSRTALGNWEHELSRPPERRNLLALADLTGVPYLRIVDAALADAGYIPEAVAREQDAAARAKEMREYREIWIAARALLIAGGLDESKAVLLATREVASGKTPEHRRLYEKARSLLKRELKTPDWVLAAALTEPTDEMQTAADARLFAEWDHEREAGNLKTYTLREFIEINHLSRLSEPRELVQNDTPAEAEARKILARNAPETSAREREDQEKATSVADAPDIEEAT